MTTIQSAIALGARRCHKVAEPQHTEGRGGRQGDTKRWSSGSSQWVDPRGLGPLALNDVTLGGAMHLEMNAGFIGALLGWGQSSVQQP